MPRSRPRHYLRTVRLAAGLSQAELGTLLGVSEDVVSNVERERTIPTLAVVFGLWLVFGKAPAELFPSLCEGIVDGVGARALGFDETLRDRPDAATRKKLTLLKGMTDRLAAPTGL